MFRNKMMEERRPANHYEYLGYIAPEGSTVKVLTWDDIPTPFDYEELTSTKLLRIAAGIGHRIDTKVLQTTDGIDFKTKDKIQFLDIFNAETNEAIVLQIAFVTKEVRSLFAVPTRRFVTPIPGSYVKTISTE
jgi:hypothetical protein